MLKRFFATAALGVPLMFFHIDVNGEELETRTEASQAVSSATRLTSQEKSVAEAFLLTEDEFLQYKKIMEGPRKYWNPDGLDPLTALGVSEEDPQKRRYWAEKWMRVEAHRVELELAFEVTRMQVAKEMFSGTPVVRTDEWQQSWEAGQTEVQYRVMFFVDPKCIEDCRGIYQDLYATSVSAPNSQLDIYFTPDTTDSEVIGSWAQKMGIDPEIVRARKVTLNYAEGMFERYGVSPYQVPQVQVLNDKTGETQVTFTPEDTRTEKPLTLDAVASE